jgi:glycerate-2-kinase
LVLGGETTVTITGRAGIGGRNQEAALACARQMPGSTLVACMGTDGIDGNSDAAGALVSDSTLERAISKRVNLARHLFRHDSYSALRKTGSLILTGRTGTNVNDIAIVYSPR